MGAPKGNKNGRNAKEFQRALRAELHFFQDAKSGIEKGKALARIARNLVEGAAIEGRLECIQEIANRLDGKPTEHIQGEFTHAIASEMTDDELLDIASRGRAGAPDAQESPQDPPGLH